MSPTGLLTLLQLADSAFPAGAFAQSDGLEALLADGLLGPENLGLALAAHRRLSLTRGEADFVRRAWRAVVTGDGEALHAAAGRDLAARPASEQRASSLAVGGALLRAAAAAVPSDEAAAVAAVRASLGELTPRATAFGAIAAALGGGEHESADAYGYTVLAGLVAAAVRLGRIGPLQGQKLLRNALAEPPAAAGEEALFSPLLDVAAMRHEVLQPRLFAS